MAETGRWRERLAARSRRLAGWLAVPRQLWALIGVTLLLLAVLGAIEGVLADMHLPGAARATVTGVAHPLTSVDDARASLEVWDDWNDSLALTQQQQSSVGWSTWWLAIDSLFAVCLGTVIGLLAWRRRTKVSIPPPESRTAAAGVVALLWTVPWVAAGYVVFDLAENAATWLAIADADVTMRTAMLWVVRLASAAKWIAVAAAVAPLLVSYVACRELDRDGRRDVVATVLQLRAQAVTVALVVVVLVALPGNIRPQLHDLVLDWSSSPGAALAAVLGIAALTVAIWLTGVQALAGAGSGKASGPASPRRLAIVGAAGVAVMGVGWLADRVPAIESGIAAYVVGALLLGWAVLGAPGPVRRIENRRAPFVRRNGVLRLLTVLPAFALLIAWLRAVVPVADLSGAGLAVAAVVALATVIAAWALTWGLHVDFPDRRPLARALVGAAVASVGIVPLVAAASRPLVVAPAIGGVALLSAAMLVVLGGLTVAMAMFAGPPRAALALVGFHRVPVVSAVLAVTVTAALFADDPGFHRVRTLDAQAARDTRPVTVERALDAWLESPSPAADPDRGWRPLLIVSSSGGGGRALYWTLLTMNCLFADAPDVDAPACGAGIDQYPSMFAASGISGGSVGLAMFASEPGLAPDDAFGAGFVEPVIANLLAIDAPNAIVQSPVWRDRATVLERAWEDRVADFEQPFLGRWRHLATDADDAADEARDVAWDPLLLLNSSAVEDGCRMNVSALTVAAGGGTVPATPATLSGSCRAFHDLRLGVPRRDADGRVLPRWAAPRDVASVLCADDDVRLSTAALLSARFPYVSPSGALEYCDSGGRFTFLMDGGALDASGAGPATLLLDEVATRVRDHNLANPGAPCVQPIVLQVDNGYEDLVSVARPSRPREALAPIVGGLRAITANAEMARQQLAELGSTLRDRSGCAAAVPDIPTFLHVYPQSHPGVKAPLGWSLSQRSRDDMEQQLRRPENQCALLTVRYWLTGSTAGAVCLAGTVQDAAVTPAAVARTEVCWPDRRACTQTDAFGGFVLLDRDTELPADPGGAVIAPSDDTVRPVDASYAHATAGRELAFDVRFETSRVVADREPALGVGHVVLVVALLVGLLAVPAGAITWVAWRRWPAVADLAGDDDVDPPR